MLYGRCLSVLRARGIPNPPERSFTLCDNRDGTGAFIETWDGGVLGPRPTPSELAAVTDTQALNEQLRERRVGELRPRVLRAFSLAIHRRFGRPDAATMTLGTWRTLLETAWDDVGD